MATDNLLRPRCNFAGVASLSEVYTHDVEEAADLVTRAYAPHRLEVRDTGGFGMYMKLMRAGRMNIGHTSFDSYSIILQAPPMLTYYALSFTSHGSLQVKSGGQTANVTPATAVIIAPTDALQFDSASPNCKLLSVRLDRTVLQDELAAMLGRPVGRPVLFDFTADLSRGPGAHVARAVRIACDEISEPEGIAHNAILASRLEQLVCSSLLVSQAHSYSEELAQDDRPALPAAVRTVVDVVEADPMAVTTAGDMARIGTVSLRSLEQGFIQSLGVSPMAYLRQVRLARVRADLRHADPATTTVSAVAHRWGFFHLGRFAATYQAAYGCRPSDDLRSR